MYNLKDYFLNHFVVLGDRVLNISVALIFSRLLANELLQAGIISI